MTAGKNKKVYLNYTCPICHKTHRVYYKREDLPRYLYANETMVCRDCLSKPTQEQLSLFDEIPDIFKE